MTPCQKLLKQEGTARRIESMQQSSATPSLHLWGLRKIVACSQSSSQCLLVSTVFGTVSSLHPTSFLMIFTLVYIYRAVDHTVHAVESTAPYPFLVAGITILALKFEGEETSSLHKLFAATDIVLVATKMVATVTTYPLPTIAAVAA